MGQNPSSEDNSHSASQHDTWRFISVFTTACNISPETKTYIYSRVPIIQHSIIWHSALSNIAAVHTMIVFYFSSCIFPLIQFYYLRNMAKWKEEESGSFNPTTTWSLKEARQRRIHTKICIQTQVWGELQVVTGLSDIPFRLDNQSCTVQWNLNFTLLQTYINTLLSTYWSVISLLLCKNEITGSLYCIVLSPHTSMSLP
jgi:hypothetical protein